MNRSRMLAWVALCGILSLAGCAAEPDHGKAKPQMVKAAEFKARHARVGMAETMHHTEFIGIVDGVAILRVQDMRPLRGGWSKRLIGVKLADLDEDFRAELEAAAKRLKAE